MAAPKKAAPQRRLTGQGQGEGRASTGTRTARGRNVEAPAEVQAAKVQDAALDPVTLISGRGGFQLIAGGKDPDTGKWHEEWTLEFGRKGFIVGDAQTIAAVEKVLAGEWEDPSSPRVSPRDFQRNGRMCRLNILKHGLEQPPIPAWESLASDVRVESARAAGFLSSVDQIRKAIRYEKQSAERTRTLTGGQRRDADPVTLQLLESMLDGGKVADTGGAASAGGLQAGAQEL